MEKHLDKVMEDILETTPGAYGCVFADHQGLCLGVMGTASTDSSGIIAAIAEQAGKLEPNNRPPIITFEGETKVCVIQRTGTITGAIYRTK